MRARSQVGAELAGPWALGWAGAAAFAVILALGLAPARAEDPTDLAALEARLQRVAHEATPKTVMVHGLLGLGTGAVIDARGTVVTNAHVAALAKQAVILRHDGTRALYVRRGIDYERDLCVLVPANGESYDGAYYEMRPDLGRPAAGEWVAALGYPGGPRGDAMPTFTAGRVMDGPGLARVSGIFDYSDAIRIDVPIYSGNSGGPLVDLEGRLVGINGAVDFSGSQVAGLAIPADVVRRIVDSMPADYVRMPGGAVLDMEERPLLRLLDELLDPMIAERMDALRKLPLTRRPGKFDLPGRREGPEQLRKLDALVRFFLERVDSQTRCETYAKGLAALEGPPSLVLRDVAGNEGLGTYVAGVGVVVSALPFMPLADMLTDAEGHGWRVIRRSPADKLLLLEAVDREGSLRGTALLDSPPAVGSIVQVRRRDGTIAAGVVSAGTRPMAGGNGLVPDEGFAARARKLLGRLIELAEAIGEEEIARLGRELEAMMRMSQALAAWGPELPYAGVMSVDVPLGPLDAGAAVFDREGRLVGVVAETAHYGTSYVVPVDRIRSSFTGAETPPGAEEKPTERPSRPERPRREPVPF